MELTVVNVICNTAFGFCDSVKMAMVIRFFTGLLDGTIPVCKTIQTEVSTPETIGFVSSLFFVGGAIGGYVYCSLFMVVLSDPRSVASSARRRTFPL